MGDKEIFDTHRGWPGKRKSANSRVIHGRFAVLHVLAVAFTDVLSKDKNVHGSVNCLYLKEEKTEFIIKE